MSSEADEYFQSHGIIKSRDFDMTMLTKPHNGTEEFERTPTSVESLLGFKQSGIIESQVSNESINSNGMYSGMNRRNRTRTFIEKATHGMNSKPRKSILIQEPDMALHFRLESDEFDPFKQDSHFDDDSSVSQSTPSMKHASSKSCAKPPSGNKALLNLPNLSTNLPSTFKQSSSSKIKTPVTAQNMSLKSLAEKSILKISDKKKPTFNALTNALALSLQSKGFKKLGLTKIIEAGDENNEDDDSSPSKFGQPDNDSSRNVPEVFNGYVGIKLTQKASIESLSDLFKHFD